MTNEQEDKPNYCVYAVDGVCDCEDKPTSQENFGQPRVLPPNPPQAPIPDGAMQHTHSPHLVPTHYCAACLEKPIVHDQPNLHKIDPEIVHEPEKQNNDPANSNLEAENRIKPTVQFDPPTIQKTAEIVGKPDRWADSVPEDTDTNVGISSPDQLRDYLIRLVDSAVTQHRLEINLPTQPGRSVMTSLEVAETIESLISQRLLSELQSCLTGEEDPRVALSKRINELRGQ